MPETMKAWQKHFGPTEPQLVEVPVPTCGEDGLLIKVHAAGVCHSDFALLNMQLKPPYMEDKYTLGHEGAGEIIEIGSKVPSGRFKVGDRIAVLSVAGCQEQTCGECSRDLAQICQVGEHYGIGKDGSYAPYITIKHWAATPLPDNVSYQAGAVATDACMTAYHAVVGTGDVQAGDNVLLIGIGGLGFNAMQIAKARGARVIVRDNRQEVLDEAKKFGIAEHDIVPVDKKVDEWVKEQGLIVDTVVDFAGKEETFEAAQNAVRFGGKLVQVGLLSPTITINNFLAVRKHLKILCSYGGTMADLKACLELISSGELRPQVEVGELENFDKVLQDLHSGKIKSRIALVPKL